MEATTAAPTADDDSELPAILFDSGTESYSDSPIAEEEGGCCSGCTRDTFTLITCQSYAVTDVALASSTCNVRRRTMTSMKHHIIDRSISVDEDILLVPLKPIPYNNTTLNRSTISSDAHNDIMNSRLKEICSTATAVQPLATILRSASCSDNANFLIPATNTERKVQFPDQESVLATYREPDTAIPFELTEIYYSTEILEEYHRSCMKHRAEEFDSIKTQLADIKHNTNRSAVFNLANVRVTMEVCETLENLFRITNFHSISLKDSQFTAESIREFVNMLEYYNCASELVLSDLFVEPDNFKMFCTIVSKMLSLESLCFHSMNINDQQMRSLLQNVRINDNINTIKFDRCHFNVVLVFNSDDMTKNHAIRELYLPHSGIYAREADFLSKYLLVNRQLRVLDISNNPLGDRGLDALTRSFCLSDLSVLVIFNDQLSEKSGSTINNILISCLQLHTLNIGFNNLTDQVIEAISPGLEQTTSLEGLGMQQTLLTCRGVSTLASIVQKNKSLQKLNLKCNKGIQVEGLEKLCQALTNTKILKLEIDENNRNCHDCKRYSELVQNLNGICSVNQSLGETDTEITTLLWRKVSLNCEPIYIPLVEPLTVSNPRCTSASPVTSPVITPGTRIGRTRFSIVKIPALEESSPPKTIKSNQSYYSASTNNNNNNNSQTSGQQSVNGRFRVFTVSPVPTGNYTDSDDIRSPVRSPGLLSCCDSVSSSPSPSVTDDDDTASCQLQPHTFQNVRSSVSSIDSVDSVQVGEVGQGGTVGSVSEAQLFSSRDSLLFDSSATPSCESD